MAEDTNVGVTVFVADVTCMRCLGSDGIAALVYACPLVRCCSQQFIFPCLQMLFSSTLCSQFDKFDQTEKKDKIVIGFVFVNNIHGS